LAGLEQFAFLLPELVGVKPAFQLFEFLRFIFLGSNDLLDCAIDHLVVLQFVFLDVLPAYRANLKMS